jgi:hypothetical protein
MYQFLFLIFAFMWLPAFSDPAIPYIKIDIIARKLYLMQDEQVVKKYSIGVGRSKQFMTPPGIYKVEVKDDNPGWINPYDQKAKIPPGQNNPLGTRWIGFHGQGKAVYGIHGTNQPTSIGKFASHGCIRMLVPDSEDLFNRIEVGTKVLVVYNRYELTERDSDLILTVHEDPYAIKPLTAESLEAEIKQKYPNAVVNKAALKTTIEGNMFDQSRLVGYLQD